MKADRYRFDGTNRCDLRELPCNGKDDDLDKETILAKTAENLQEMAALQDALYADGREGVIFVLQALDAAGKDSTIKHVMGGLNPQGVQVTSFKQPSSEELRHDFLWRVHKALPPRGGIAIFNRSYYEDVLVVQLHELYKGYKMPPRTLDGGKKEFFKKRYRQIEHYEEYLYENGYRIVKIFLHVSKKEQKKRFLERIWGLGDKIVEGEGYRPALEATVHRTIKKVGEDIDALKANTAIAQLMIYVNALYDNGGATRAELEVLLQLLNPFAPHMTEEMWQQLGHIDQLAYHPWPSYDEAKCVEQTIEIAVQVNGKVKARIQVAADIEQADAIAQAKAEPAVQEALAGKTIVKEIYVKGKLVNLAAKG